VFTHFTHEYPGIEKYRPKDLFPKIKVKDTTGSLLSNDFFHQFIPEEVEIDFKKI
jgi:hypothetical protein